MINPLVHEQVISILGIGRNWFTEELKENSKYVTVLDYKPKLDKDTKVWKYMNVKKVSHKELEEMLVKVEGAYKKLITVCNKIRKAKLR